MARDTAYDDIADQGEVLVDNRTLYSVLQKQEKALRALKYKETVNPNLPALLSNPECATISKEALRLEYFNEIDASKQDAVRRSLLATDLFLIQGPPGTGKTTVISELVSQIATMDKRAKILISSQSNVAVNHALMRISKIQPDLPMIRIGRKDKISQGAESYSFESRVIAFAERTRDKSNNYALEYKSKLNISDDVLDSLTLLEEVKQKHREIRGLSQELENTETRIIEVQEIESLLNEKNMQLTFVGRNLITSVESISEHSQLYGFLEQAIADYIGLGEQLFKIIRDNKELAKLHILMDKRIELQKKIETFTIDCLDTCNLICDTLNISIKDENIDSLIAKIEESTVRYKVLAEGYAKLESIRKEWLKRVENINELEEICIKEAIVVAATCLGIAATQSVHNLEFDYVIVDEAGRATSPEILVPIVRGKKIILVGDQKQLPPVVDSSISDELLSQLNLTRKELESTLFEKLFREVSETVKCTLLEQYRMHPAIGNLISYSFYNSQLIAKTKADDRKHELIWWPKSIMWFSTSKLNDRHEQIVGMSRQNKSEAKHILNLLEDIEKQYRKSEKHRDVAVITGYLPQKQLLRTFLDVEDKNRWKALSIEIDTVDAFQGRETDIVIYSIVRSNMEKQIGFLKDYRRLNVALSRAKQFLIIVGDHEMMKSSTISSSTNPFIQVIDYLNSNQNDCGLEVLIG